MSSTEPEDCVPTPPPLPPAPPPPPPPPASSTVRKKGGAISCTTDQDASEQNWCRMIEEACEQSRRILFQSEDEPCSIISLYLHCDSVLQSGPTCGLVALMMCIKLVRPDLQTDLGTVLLQAQSFGYTKFGEMFNVESMCKFINDVFFVRAECRQWLECSQLEAIEHLCHGQPILLPYDADANYEPCLKGGKRAHWAAITGFVLSLRGDSAKEHLDSSYCTVVTLADRHSLIHIDPEKADDQKKATKLCKSLLPKSQLFFYSRQGKSKRVQIWNFSQLCTSNRNLSQVSDKILDDPERVRMVYPDKGDLTLSLANQFILVYK